jgi:hypothetical protein
VADAFTVVRRSGTLVRYTRIPFSWTVTKANLYPVIGRRECVHDLCSVSRKIVSILMKLVRMVCRYQKNNLVDFEANWSVETRLGEGVPKRGFCVCTRIEIILGENG